MVTASPDPVPQVERSSRHAAASLTAIAPRVDLPSPDAIDHVVLFYDADAYLLDNVVNFVAPAVCGGRRGIVVATPEHRAAIESRLAVRGIDVAAARAAGSYLSVDARQTLARFMVEGWPRADQFAAVLDELLDGTRRERPACIFGEMVALLVADGLTDAALELESLWNRERAVRPFALLCGYPMDQFGRESMAPALEETSEAHSAVIPCESYSTLTTVEGRLREIVALQQKAASLERALESEREARVAAEAALHVRDEFLSTASHELRTPLSVLGVQAQMSLRHYERLGLLETDRAVAALRTISGQVDKLSRLVDQLLDVSRLDSGKLLIEPQPTDLSGLVTQIVENMRPLCERRPLSADVAERVTCIVDPLRIEQVLVNLFDNAMKYSPDGAPIDVRLSLDAGGAIEISLTDGGPGIAPAKRARIFDRFFQADETNGRSGLGLGLYLCRNIVERHGGELRAEFPETGGTRFVIRLPG